MIPLNEKLRFRFFGRLRENGLNGRSFTGDFGLGLFGITGIGIGIIGIGADARSVSAIGTAKIVGTRVRRKIEIIVGAVDFTTRATTGSRATAITTANAVWSGAFGKAGEGRRFGGRKRIGSLRGIARGGEHLVNGDDRSF
jgi:hypothetical protein